MGFTDYDVKGWATRRSRLAAISRRINKAERELMTAEGKASRLDVSTPQGRRAADYVLGLALRIKGMRDELETARTGQAPDNRNEWG